MGADSESVMESQLPRVLLMGQTRAGKTSIRKVIFNKMAPQETTFIKPTEGVTVAVVNNSAFVNFEMVEFPGALMAGFPNAQLDIKALNQHKFLDRRCGAIILVLDSQDSVESWREEIKKMCIIAQEVHSQGLSKSISFEIFLHKAEGVLDEKKTDLQREANTIISESLDDAAIGGAMQCTCHVTSIYDQSVFECFSKVARKLLHEEGLLENLLDTMVNSCRMVKAYMFDMRSKICVASDSCICLERHNELCSDMIDIVTDFSAIYGSGDGDFDPESFSIIKLDTKSCSNKARQNTVLLYLRAVAPNVALVCVIEQEAYDGKMGLIDYNFALFRNRVDELIQGKESIKSNQVQAIQAP